MQYNFDPHTKDKTLIKYKRYNKEQQIYDYRNQKPQLLLKAQGMKLTDTMAASLPPAMTRWQPQQYRYVMTH